MGARMHAWCVRRGRTAGKGDVLWMRQPCELISFEPGGGGAMKQPQRRMQAPVMLVWLLTPSMQRR